MPALGVLTIRAATTLLAQADSLDALNNLAHKLGFETPMLHVTADALQSLGIAEWVTEARLSPGVGALRLVAAQLIPDSPHNARDLTRQICQAITRNAPTRLWCVATLDASGNALCIACVASHPNGPRVAALRIDRQHVVDSDADTLRALASVPADHD
ncbi:MAG: hypothetical protein ABI852_17455, partial [Gemmatimonadaceae bacterium]